MNEQVAGMLLNDVSLYDGMRVLNVAAGDGVVLQALHKAAYAGMVTLDVTAVEKDPDKAATLTALASQVVVGDWTDEGRYDLVLMDAPYMTRIRRAWDLLLPNGRLHATVPAGLVDDEDAANFVKLRATDPEVPWLKADKNLIVKLTKKVQTP